VPLTPAAVAYFSSNGHRIVIESGAGRNANFSDIQFSEAGAEIVHSNKDVYACDTILKIDPPTLTEIELMKPGQLLISALQINQLDSVVVWPGGGMVLPPPSSANLQWNCSGPLPTPFWHAPFAGGLICFQAPCCGFL
jgi:hypothetical protein